jgi:hypothetical protein
MHDNSAVRFKLAHWIALEDEGDQIKARPELANLVGVIDLVILEVQHLKAIMHGQWGKIADTI